MRRVKIFLAITVFISFFKKSVGNETTKPNIILLVADDLGWNDVGFHGSNEIPTPNIDALAYHGTILNRHYTQSVCTPSRAALMTGKYPIRMGFQGGALRNAYPISLPLNETILPQYLKRQGYATSLVGKWHLGFHRKIATPNERGFDSFFGFYTGAVRYNDSVAVMGSYPAFDARNNFEPAGDQFFGKYNTEVFADEAVRIIQQHNSSKALFLEVAFSAVHAISKGVLQVRNFTENEAKFSYIGDKNRRMFAGALSVLDESVGKIIRALDQQNLLRNSIILFISDNGAASDPTMFQNHGSNWPLRGNKASFLEGAVRGVSAIWSPSILQNTVLNNFMHLTDWVPTFYAAAGGGRTALSGIDGINHWDYLRGADDKQPRTEILVNVDEKSGSAALIKEGWKLIRSKNESTKYCAFKGWQWSSDYQIDKVLSCPTHTILSKYNKKPLVQNDFLGARRKANIKDQCELRLNQTDEVVNKETLPCFKTGCLFNLENDPCEFTDLSRIQSQKMAELNERLKVFEGQLVKQWNAQPDPKASPQNFHNYWTSWID